MKTKELLSLTPIKKTLLIFVFFSFGFFYYFPLNNIVQSKLKSTLSSIPGCNIFYDDLTFEFFLPKIKITNLKLPKSCFGSYGDPLLFKEIFFKLEGPAFSPFGLKLSLQTSLKKMPLEVHIVLGLFGSNLVKIQNNKIKLDLIKDFFQDFSLDGEMRTDLYAIINQNSFEDLKINLHSKNFVLPSQTIQNFKLPMLALNQFSLKAQMQKKQTLEVMELTLGDIDSLIRANFKGKIFLNNHDLSSSALDLKGEIFFKESFLESFSIIKLFLSRFTKKDDFYQISLKGTFGSPEFSE